MKKISILLICLSAALGMSAQGTDDEVHYESMHIGGLSKSSIQDAALTIKGFTYIGDVTTAKKIKDEYVDKFLLWVEKGIVAEDLAIAKKDLWLTQPDYVFAPDYKLPTLEEIKAYVTEHRHLPGVISEAELKERGMYQLNETLQAQLKNLEELVLHTIAQEKKLREQKALIQSQHAMIDDLEAKLAELEALIGK